MGRRTRRRDGWQHRLYAALLPRFHQRYAPLVAERKRELLGGLSGTVLEIGAGTGANLPYLGRDVRWIGLDPNPYTPRYARESASRAGVAALFGSAVAEQLPAADESVDAVISTLVLCCVEDPGAALREIVRVLKPGGRFVFIEHVAAPEGTRTRRWQTLVLPLWKRFADGCHPNRETWRWIESAGFARVRYDRFRLPMPIAGPHMAGEAVKQGAIG
ncbi:MAG: class I SAM-dependent methyltransferase [Bryobacteraceae bacterium]|nr:class I SAM-dependent methyltransferase [Bryobacteraceae bacterium]